MRSHLVLEIASELVDRNDWQYRQARISLREQGADHWPVNLFGSDGPDSIHQIARGELQVATINPAAPLALALKGTGPFKTPIAVRAIAVIPSYDQLVLGVAERTGLKSLNDIREKRYPLRVSLRGQRDHSVHPVLDEVLAAAGFSLGDIIAWGGEVHYDDGLPSTPNRMGPFQRGERDAMFDEAVKNWLNMGLDAGIRVLPLEGDLLRKLEALGFRRGTIERARFPRLSADIPTLDFSGFPLFTHADVPHGMIHSICAALEARKHTILWEGEGPLPLDRMCRDTPEGPLNIPLHPAAEKFWRECGYLS
ncbi:MAG TPA: TAXI family TRAP transporter solute-binding subunit [Candidatus Binatia bacterium]|jgi:TRAP-type uncharacterized transport system substrate-binding protein